jgi:hypothetical protein
MPELRFNWIIVPKISAETYNSDVTITITQRNNPPNHQINPPNQN